MSLSWNYIKTRAAAFVLDWKDSQAVREKAETQNILVTHALFPNASLADLYDGPPEA
jgi:hypothetical protein